MAAFLAPLIAVVTGGALYGWSVVAIPAVVLVALIAVLLVVGTRSSLDATHEVLGLRRELAAHVTDSVFGAAEVVGYGRQQDRMAEMAHLDGQIAEGSAKARRYVAVRRAACVAAAMGIVVSVTLMAIHEGIGAVGVCALAAAGLRIVEGPRGIEDAVGYLDHSLAAARRLWQISHSPMEVVDGPRELCLDHAPTVEWRDVTFSYREADGTVLAPALEDVSLSVPAGGHIVVTGASGSGKTTLVITTLTPDRSSSTVSRSRRSPWTPCVAPWRWCPSAWSCSTPRSRTTYDWPFPMPATMTCGRCLGKSDWPRRCEGWTAVWAPSSAHEERDCREVKPSE